MNEEEALEIFKNLILLPYDWKITDNYKGTINFIGAIEGNEAIEIISNLIEKLQKENEELKRLHIQDNKHLDFIMEHSIPVQKVKDKIDEILNNGEYRIIFEGDAEFPDEATIINAQRYIKLEKLQELLEERKLEED